MKAVTGDEIELEIEIGKTEASPVSSQKRKQLKLTKPLKYLKYFARSGLSTSGTALFALCECSKPKTRMNPVK